jgi:uncharacterized membrane protein
LPRTEDGEFELVLGNKQLLSVFFIMVVLLGVFFAMGYIAGRNSAPSVADARKGDATKPIVVDSSQRTSAMPDSQPQGGQPVQPPAETPAQPAASAPPPQQTPAPAAESPRAPNPYRPRRSPRPRKKPVGFRAWWSPKPVSLISRFWLRREPKQKRWDRR